MLQQAVHNLFTSMNPLTPSPLPLQICSLGVLANLIDDFYCFA